MTRFKHWFQDEKVVGKKTQTILISIFRDPYYWVNDIQRKPRHASKHIHLTWKIFLTKTWTMDRVGHDLELTKDINLTGVEPNDIRLNITYQQKL